MRQKVKKPAGRGNYSQYEDLGRSRPTPERLLKAGEKGYVIGSGEKTMTMRDSAIDRLRYSRKVIDDKQHKAGSDYYDYWVVAGSGGHLVSFDLGRVGSFDVTKFTGLARSEWEQRARDKLFEANTELKGSGGHLILQLAICLEEPLEEVGRCVSAWKSRTQLEAAAIQEIKLHLNSLVRLWGL